MEFLDKNLGQYVLVEVKSADGKVLAQLSIDAAKMIDDGFAKVKAKIPGQVDDVILDLVAKELKSAFLGVSDAAPAEPVAPSVPAPSDGSAPIQG